MNMLVRYWGFALASFALLLPGLAGCSRTPPPPPPITDEIKAAIKTEDQKVFDAERAQR